MIRYKNMDRKSIVIAVGPAGVEVRLPRWLSSRDPSVRKMLLEHLGSAARRLPDDPAPASPLTREQFYDEVRAWARRLGVRPTRVSLSRMTRRWASCTSKGTVTISDRVLDMPASLRHYLICHELTHLRVLNHGPEFRRLMSEAMPDWRERERHLTGWVAAAALRTLQTPRRRRLFDRTRQQA